MNQDALWTAILVELAETLTSILDDPSAGVHANNPVFTMRPYYWGECDCGYDDALHTMMGDRGHAEQCLRHDTLDVFQKCTCGFWDEIGNWEREHRHADTCSTELANFRHHGTGLEIRWYQRIGCSMEISRDLSVPDILTIGQECFAMTGEATHV